MIYLLASIISSSSIYVIFSVAKNYNCKLNLIITLNYLVATILGFAILLKFEFSHFLINNHWLPYGIALGVLFILMFYLIGNSSQKAGIAVTTLANKLSLVFPVFFSLLYFDEKITGLKYGGLTLALVAVSLTVYKKDVQKTKWTYIALPLILFVGSGITDSMIKYVQATQISEEQTTAYTTFVFFTAFVCGLIISLLKTSRQSKPFHGPSWLLGLFLGLVNFGSLWFFINALNKSNLESSLVFALNNMTIVALSAMLGAFIFREKLNKFNLAGIVLAIISLYILLR